MQISGYGNTVVSAIAGKVKCEAFMQAPLLLCHQSRVPTHLDSLENEKLISKPKKPGNFFKIHINKKLYRAFCRQANGLTLNTPVFQGLLRVNRKAEERCEKLGSRTKSSRTNPPGQNPPQDKIPPGQNPPGQNPPNKISPVIFYIQYPLATQILNIF